MTALVRAAMEATRVFATVKMRRVMHQVGYLARMERKRLRKAKREFWMFSAFAALFLIFEWSTAYVVFDYIVPTIGDVQMGGGVLALSVGIVVLAMHFLITRDKNLALEAWLKRLAAIGVCAFALGMSTMLALVMVDGTIGIGQSGAGGISGNVGQSTIGLPGADTSSSLISQLFEGVLSTISPLLFFCGIMFCLLISFYVVHRLIKLIEERYEMFSDASDRATQVKSLVTEFDEIDRECEVIEERRQILIRRLPPDLEAAFARTLFAAVNTKLHAMHRSLDQLDPQGVGSIFPAREPLPDHIKSREDGKRLIAEIRDAMRPFAVMNNLGATAPKET